MNSCNCTMIQKYKHQTKPILMVIARQRWAGKDWAGPRGIGVYCIYVKDTLGGNKNVNSHLSLNFPKYCQNFKS